MRVTLTNNRTVVCRDEPLHSGAEGEVYVSADGETIVKLYFQPDPDRKRTLEAIIDQYNAVRDDAYWGRYFCWPEGIVEQPSLGVVMPHASTDLRGLDWFLMPKARARLRPDELGTWEGHIVIAMRLSRAMRRLHQLGLCHSDLSHKNCLVNPNTGQLTLIDLDGLVVPGILPPRVFGTVGFMAPEIITASANPSNYTDLHALAVLIYQTLLFRHPLKGPKIHSTDTEEDDRLAFGEKALYIEHPTDHSNRPRSLSVTSAMLGPQLAGLMQQAFIKGLHHPAERPMAAKWEEALIRLRDRLVPCGNPDCEGKLFPFTEGQPLVCPWCGTAWRSLSTLAVLDLYRPVSGRKGQYVSDGYSIVAYPNRKISEWHVHPGRSPGPDSSPDPVATFEYEAGKDRWFMVNQSDSKMRVMPNSQSVREYGKGDRWVLSSEMRILLGEGPNVRLAQVRLGKVT